MDFLKSALSPLMGSNGAIPDTLKLVVIGGTVETARRVSASAWSGFVDSFFLTAHFSQDDHPYDWLMLWLSKQPAWGRSREFDITTRSTGRHSTVSAGDLEDDEDDESGLVHGRKKRKVAFTPSVDTTHTIYYRGHWLRITRTRRFQDYAHCNELKISVVARNNDILKKLVLEAKRMYEKDAEHRVHIFIADASYPCWRYNGSRQKRPMTSIVLEPGVKEMLLADCKDFIQSEDWYAERGIPFRRGYLLHGVPGSGKTSLIHSLAGELGLDIYVISLSAKGMSDNTLTNLMGHVPSRCILLLEDLDAAFTRSVSRDTTATGAPPAAGTATAEAKPADDGSTLSLSGLLNSLDGVAAAEGRLLFATTNHIERLDPALSRPGRMDVWVNFKHATKWQAEGIFKCFFPVKPATAPPASATSSEASSAASSRASSPAPSAAVSPTASCTDLSQRNLPGIAGKPSAHAIPLLDEDELTTLARRFGESIPEDEFSVASLQGYLLKNKTRPRESVDEVQDWIKQERETRAKLKKEKEEADAKAKKEAEEAARKEKEEKEKTEKAERETKEKEEREAKEKERAERKESRAKSKKSRAETSSKHEAPSAPAAPIESPSTSDSSPSASSASESSSDESSCNTGAEGDTESVTSDSEPEKAASGTDMPSSEPKKEKWVAIKGGDAAATAPAAAAAPAVAVAA